MSEFEINRLVANLQYPPELLEEPDDTSKDRKKKGQLRTKFKQLYTTMITSGSVDSLLRVIGESMRQNFFVSLHGTETYFQFDNPSSRKYISRLHELGMLTDDSDVFDYDKPSSPIILPSGRIT